jgi:hypothetical protein
LGRQWPLPLNGANVSFSDLGSGKLSAGMTFIIIDNIFRFFRAHLTARGNRKSLQQARCLR